MEIRENHPLKAKNTFGLDVRAKYYTEISSTAELSSLFSGKLIREVPHLILGGGSNILFTNPVYEGLVIGIKLFGKTIEESDSNHVLLKAMAGEPWDELVAFAVSNNWGGLENLSLIPGLTGASPIQNIGAYGTDISDVFVSLEAFDKNTGTVKKFHKDECHFGYRDSYFKNQGRNQYIITSVTFRLSTKEHIINTGYGDIARYLSEKGIYSPGIQHVREAVVHIRNSKLPDPSIIGNAGSFFKNPVVPMEVFEKLRSQHPDLAAYPDPGGMKLAAGWLIDKCGWKGFRSGDSGVHQHQALVLVNHGKATGMQILDLAQEIRASVFQHFGIDLETEVNII